MKLISVNVGMPREVRYEGKIVTTGIFKEPVEGRVMVRRTNLDGDGQADPEVHGGASKAVSAYPIEHYATWRRELGRDDLPVGLFGENFTVQGMTEEEVRIGDVYRIGGATVEVTEPRLPCLKLAMRIGLPDFPKAFLASGRTGFYFKVIEEGDVGAGDRIERIDRRPDAITVLEACRRRTEDPG